MITTELVWYAFTTRGRKPGTFHAARPDYTATGKTYCGVDTTRAGWQARGFPTGANVRVCKRCLFNMEAPR